MWKSIAAQPSCQPDVNCKKNVNTRMVSPGLPLHPSWFSTTLGAPQFSNMSLCPRLPGLPQVPATVTPRHPLTKASVRLPSRAGTCTLEGYRHLAHTVWLVKQATSLLSEFVCIQVTLYQVCRLELRRNTFIGIIIALLL